MAPDDQNSKRQSYGHASQEHPKQSVSIETVRYFLDRSFILGWLIACVLELGDLRRAAAWVTFVTILAGGTDIIFYFRLHAHWLSWGLFTACAVVGLLIFVQLDAAITHPETRTHGWLEPGDEPSRPEPCALQLPSPGGGSGLGWLHVGTFKPNPALFIHLGAVVIAAGPGLLSVTAIRIAGDDVLTLRWDGDRLSVSANIFDKDDNIIAQVINNEFSLNPNAFSRAPHPDKHHLIVYDNKLVPVLTVAYANAHTIRITGTFWRHGTKLALTKDMLLGGGMCLADAAATCPTGGAILRAAGACIFSGQMSLGKQILITPHWEWAPSS
jgi:hypothetical protein